MDGEPEPDGSGPDDMGLISSTGDLPPTADRGRRLLSDCEVTALVAPSGAIEWMCLPRMDCRACSAPSWTGGRQLPVRPGERGRASRPALPARDHGPRDKLELRRGLDRRPDCLVMGEWRHEHQAVPGHQAANRLRRRAHAAADGARRAGWWSWRWTASRCSATGWSGPGGPGPSRAITRRRDRGGQPAGQPHLGHPVRDRGSMPRPDPAARGRHPVRALSWGRRTRRRATRRPRSACGGRRITGSTGWPGATSPTTAGAATSPGAR